MFDIDNELKMFEKLKYDGCEEPMSKKKAFDFYIPVSKTYFEDLAAGKNPEGTDPKMLEEIKTSFYTICYRLRDEEFTNSSLSNYMEVAKFYSRCGRMLGIDTSFIKPNVTGRDIFNGWIDAYWEKVKIPIMNPALGQYMFDSKTKDSPIFYCFLIGSAGYLALETAYRWGFDPIGIFRRATDEDALSLWTYRDEGYLYTKWRDDRFLYRIVSSGAKDILALGAGGMPELRRTGYFKSGAWRYQKFTACDSDPRIDFGFLMDHIDALDGPRGQVERYKMQERIDYFHLGISDMLAHLAKTGQKFDLIYIKGVVSFMKDLLKPLLQASMDLLNPGGRFMFDMQLTHFVMARDALIFGWGGGVSSSKIELLPFDTAVDFVHETAKALDIKETQIGEPDVFKDPFNHDPYGVNFTINKT